MMNTYEEVLCFLQGRMEIPQSWGWFHLMWIFVSIFAIVVLCHTNKVHKDDELYKERQLKWLLGVYGFAALALEIVKQVIWSFNYNASSDIVTWDYQWYAAPFQLCTTPIFISLSALFVKPGKLRNVFFSYLSYVTILGSFMTMLIPKNCFSDYVEVNFHTMWLHCGSFVVSMFLLITGVVKNEKRNLKSAWTVFGVALIIANILNIVVYKSGILNGETFNMFYISPYFVSELPVFDKIWESVPYPIFLAVYILAIGCGAGVIFGLHKLVNIVLEKYYVGRAMNEEV